MITAGEWVKWGDRSGVPVRGSGYDVVLTGNFTLYNTPQSCSNAIQDTFPGFPQTDLSYGGCYICVDNPPLWHRFPDLVTQDRRP